jgi:hypothetical protein
MTDPERPTTATEWLTKHLPEVEEVLGEHDAVDEINEHEALLAQHYANRLTYLGAILLYRRRIESRLVALEEAVAHLIDDKLGPPDG